ncbi:MAG: methyltransferase family protein [Pyrinomonadaceae bacterium]
MHLLLLEFHISTSLAFSLAQAAIAAVWILQYGSARKTRGYSEGRQAIAKDDRFKTFGKVIFAVNNLVTLASFWTNSKLLLLFWQEDLFRLAGVVVLVAATLLCIKSMRDLGANYSPCFDSHRPLRIVTKGTYRYVRHPLYLANILQGLGYVIVSSSLWVLLLSGFGIFKIVSALVKEESYLTKTFPGYEKYQSRTSRLIPFVY